MKRVLVIALILAALFSTLACSFVGLGTTRGNGRMSEETRGVRNVDGVALSGIGNLYIDVGDREELVIEAEENLLDLFETRVQGGVLCIGTKAGVDIRPTKPVNFYLTVKQLESIKVSGSGNVHAPALEASDFSVTISGSGDVEMAELYAGSLAAKISGSGDLEIAGGAVDEQKITISGSGTYRAMDLESSDANVKISGSGSATIQVYERLGAHISGSGTLRYAGRPYVEESISGSGSIKHVGD